uniref:LRRNT domain-containing protein n=1 Tax=Anopheles dirus TaxID=7168 RepID=A0A182NT04_9DIPT
MRRRLIWDYLVPVVLLTVLLWTSIAEVQANDDEDKGDYEVDMYADDYADTYDEEDDDISGPLPNGPDHARADSDKSGASSSSTTKVTSTTTDSPVPVVIFGDLDEHSNDQDEYACPGECSCSEGTKHVNCSHRALTEIPTGLPSNVVQLDLSHNNLKRLNVEAFQNCTGLQQLLLAGNVIEQFDKELLLKLDKLDLLDLSSNQLSHLDSDTFSEVSKSLRRLHLSDNPIVLPDSGSFLELPELEQLYLANCNLTELPEETFTNLDGLTRLDLFGNQFDEDMSVETFASLKNLMHLRMPPLSESTVRELCEKVMRIDVVDMTTHNISCFYLASETSFEDSIIVDAPKTPEPVSTTKEPTTPRPTRKPTKNLNEIFQEYKSSTTSKLQASDLALHTTTAQPPAGREQKDERRPNASSQAGSPSSVSIKHTGADGSTIVDGDGDVIKTSSTVSEHGAGGQQSLLASITPETMKQLLMAIIGVTVLGLIIGLICRRTGIKNKLCGTKRRPAPTDQVRPAEEVPLNKV